MSASHPAVEIFGPWLLNKGDQLMLRAVQQRLQDTYAIAVSSPLGMDELPEGQTAAPAGLHRIRWRPTLKEMRTAMSSGSLRGGLSALRRSAALSLAPRSMVRSRGVVDGSDLVALLDCSGFAYGDQWSPHRIQNRLVYYDRLRNRGVRLVMLPQALGPFQRPQVQHWARQLFERFDLIFARDVLSRQHVLSLGLDERTVGLCPDITHLLDPIPPDDAEVWARRVCIVPNARMLNRTSAQVSGRYVDFLTRSIRCIHECGLEPCVVLHERNDRELVSTVCEASGHSPCVIDEDALRTKGFLGACYANVGSRYHSLVSSLSMGIPSIGTSWSHKYDALFHEYGCPQWLIAPCEEPAELDRRLRRFLEPATRQALHERVRRAAAIQKEKVEAMWLRVMRLLQDSIR